VGGDLPVPVRRLLVANPSSDVYGSDLQMLESVQGFAQAGWQVEVVTPDDGPLLPRLRSTGARTRRLSFPVLRRSSMSPPGLVGLVGSVLVRLPAMVHLLRSMRPDVLYVNTVTIPWWLLAARLARVPSVCHVHEAENADSRLVRAALVSPLRLADRLIVISDSAMSALLAVDPALGKRADLVRNGVPLPPDTPLPAERQQPRHLVTVGRLSPRKAPHVALEALAVLVARGHDATLDVVGSPFEGYEWYEEELQQRAREPDLRGRVRFLGYQSPVWPCLAAAEIVMMPSLREPFGNAVVEGQLSRRAVVAADALGHRESIVQGRTGLLVPPGDAVAMADAVEQLLEDDALADCIAARAETSARSLFSVARYVREVRAVVEPLAARHQVDA
jgi:glycosyltransferase involved in cell wall biosynthesis